MYRTSGPKSVPQSTAIGRPSSIDSPVNLKSPQNRLQLDPQSGPISKSLSPHVGMQSWEFAFNRPYIIYISIKRKKFLSISRVSFSSELSLIFSIIRLEV
ncbi:hypothetical protein Dimus_012465 [Dionaea muscipula]